MAGGKVRSALQLLFLCSLSWFLLFIATHKEENDETDEERREPKLNDSLYLRFMTEDDPEVDCVAKCEKQEEMSTTLRDYGEFNANDPIRILSWTPLHSKTEGEPWFPEGEEAFDECEFDPPLQCEYTQDKNLYDTSDAVLFHSFFMKDIPQHRIAGQKWVFWENESPRIVNILQNLQPYKFVFNLTSTYSMASDVPIPYLRKCVPEEGQLNVDAERGEDFTQGKDRLVAWFASHCETPSRREGYVSELKNHIPVDVYGKCGPYKCSKANKTICLKDIVEKRYKFVLAFENSLCRDYITDTLWDIFDYRVKVVPVVLGGADYSRFLPAGTYIDIRDFKSPSHLAVYLKYLDRHPKKYNEYIWKRTFDSCDYMTSYSEYQCGLCKHLHHKRGLYESVLNAATAWGMRRGCVTPRSFYEGVASEVLAADLKEESKKPPVWGL